MELTILKDDEVKIRTSYPNCVYDDATLKNMLSSGRKFFLDGKSASLKDVKSFRDGS